MTSSALGRGHCRRICWKQTDTLQELSPQKCRFSEKFVKSLRASTYLDYPVYFNTQAATQMISRLISNGVWYHDRNIATWPKFSELITLSFDAIAIWLEISLFHNTPIGLTTSLRLLAAGDCPEWRKPINCKLDLANPACNWLVNTILLRIFRSWCHVRETLLQLD